MIKKKTSEIKVAGIAALVTCLLYSSGFLVMLTPFPLYFVATVYGKRGLKLSFFATLAAALILYFVALPFVFSVAESWSLKDLMFLVPGAGLAELFNLKSAQFVGVSYLLYFLIFGFLLGEGMIRKWSLSRLFAVSVGGSFAYLGLIFLVAGALNIDIISNLQKYMTAVLNEIVSAQEASGINTERVFILKKNAESIVAFSISIIPSVVFLMGLFVGIVNYFLAKWMIRSKESFTHLGDVTRYSVPHYFVWVTIGLGFAFFFEKYVAHLEILRFISLNGLIAMSGIYCIQGLLIISFYMRRVRARFFKTLLYVTLFMFIQVVVPTLVILGFADLWIDFRRLMRKEIITEGNQN